jgi:hypothetical protein
MSSYPPYSDASARRCHRCGRPLAPNEITCGTCGEYNYPTPTNGATSGIQPSYGTPGSGSMPPTSYGPPPGPNPYVGGNYVPPPQPPMYSHNPYAAPQPPLYSTVAPPPMTGFQQNNLNIYQNDHRPGALRQQPPPKRVPNIALIVGILILLVILLGGGFGFFYISSRLNRVASAVQPTPTPTGPPLFSDSFQNNNNGWDLTSQAGQYSVKVGGGSMVLEDDNHTLIPEFIPGTKLYDNFRLTVDATLSHGDQNNGYGVYIRGASNQTSDLATYYRFELYGDGTYAVFKGVVDATGNSQSTTLVDFTVSPVIQKQGTVNHITIIANGPSMTLIVNGQTATTVTDSSYTNGTIALFVSNLPAPTPPVAQATFNNLAIYPV